MMTDEIKARLEVLDVEMAALDEACAAKEAEFFDLFAALPPAERAALHRSFRDHASAIKENLIEKMRRRGAPEEEIDQLLDDLEALAEDDKDSGDK